MDMTLEVLDPHGPLGNHGLIEGQQPLFLRDKSGVTVHRSMPKKQGDQVMRSPAFGTLLSRAHFEGVARSAIS